MKFIDIEYTIGKTKEPEVSYRRKVERPNFTDKEWADQILKEIDELKVKEKDPNLCSHCTNLSLCERFEELGKLGIV